MSEDRMNKDSSIHPALRAIVATSLAAIGCALVWALWTMPADNTGLWPEVSARLEDAGASNPVTAVLLNFRAYDTLLEIAVLTIALLGIWSLREAPKERAFEPAGRVLSRVVSVLVPLMVLVGGYLLWAGTKHHGGAFPAAAVIAAAAVLLILSDHVARIHHMLLRLGIVVGLVTFIGVGVACSLGGDSFLEYPPGWESALILIIESAGTVSIALILASVFAGSSNIWTREARELEP